MVRNRLGWICFAIIFYLLETHPALAGKLSTEDPKTDAVMVSLQKRLKKVEACSCKVVTVVHLMGQKFQINGTAYFMVPGKMRIDKVLPGETNQTVVSDGSTLWIYDSQEKVASRTNLGRVFEATGLEADADQPDPTRPFRGLEWKQIRYMGTEVVDDVSYRVFEAKPQVTLLHAELPDVPKKARIFIHPKDGMMRSIHFIDASGEEVLSQRFEEMVINPKLDKSLFEFVIPSGVHIIDTTNEAIQILKGASENGGP